MLPSSNNSFSTAQSHRQMELKGIYRTWTGQQSVTGIRTLCVCLLFSSYQFLESCMLLLFTVMGSKSWCGSSPHVWAWKKVFQGNRNDVSRTVGIMCDSKMELFLSIKVRLLNYETVTSVAHYAYSSMMCKDKCTFFYEHIRSPANNNILAMSNIIHKRRRQSTCWSQSKSLHVNTENWVSEQFHPIRGFPKGQFSVT